MSMLIGLSVWTVYTVQMDGQYDFVMTQGYVVYSQRREEIRSNRQDRQKGSSSIGETGGQPPKATELAGLARQTQDRACGSPLAECHAASREGKKEVCERCRTCGSRPGRPQRTTRTGILEWVRTFAVSLPRSRLESPFLPCEAITIRSHFFFFAVAMICW
jgi:hypothetical protein